MLTAYLWVGQRSRTPVWSCSFSSPWESVGSLPGAGEVYFIVKCIAIFQKLAMTFIIAIIIIISDIIHNYYHRHHHPSALSSASSSNIIIISIIITIILIKIFMVGMPAPQDRSCSCFQSLLLRACETREMTFKVQNKNILFFLETVRKRSWKNSQLNQRFNIQVC